MRKKVTKRVRVDYKEEIVEDGGLVKPWWECPGQIVPQRPAWKKALTAIRALIARLISLLLIWRHWGL